MNIFLFAPKIKYQSNLFSTPLILDNGNSVKIWGFLIEHHPPTASANVTFSTSDGTVIFIASMSGGNNRIVDIPFIADKGLQVSATTDNVDITVLYSNFGT